MVGWSRWLPQSASIIRPAVVYPYHYRKLPIDEWVEALSGEPDIEIRPLITVPRECIMRDAAERYQRLWPGRFVLLLGLAFTAASCGGVSAGAGSSSSSGRFPSITGEQLREGSSATNVYDALANIRSQWLRPRPRASLTFERAQEPVVYVNGVRFGEISDLRGIHVDTVQRIEYINPLDATTRYGTGHSGGVLSVDLAPF